MQSDTALRRTYTVLLTDGNVIALSILEAQHEPEASTRQAELVQQEVMRLIYARPNATFLGLVSLLSVGEARFLSDEAKRIYTELLSVPQVERLAFVVPNSFLRLLTSFMAQLSSRWGKVRWFADESSALDWLRERQQA